MALSWQMVVIPLLDKAHIHTQNNSLFHEPLLDFEETLVVKKGKPDELRRFYIWQYLARLK